MTTLTSRLESRARPGGGPTGADMDPATCRSFPSQCPSRPPPARREPRRGPPGRTRDKARCDCSARRVAGLYNSGWRAGMPNAASSMRRTLPLAATRPWSRAWPGISSAPQVCSCVTSCPPDEGFSGGRNPRTPRTPPRKLAAGAAGGPTRPGRTGRRSPRVSFSAVPWEGRFACSRAADMHPPAVPRVRPGPGGCGERPCCLGPRQPLVPTRS